MDNVDGETVNRAIEDVIARANREWRAMGVVETDRAALTDDVRAELTGAAADGVSPRELIGDDVPAFARNLALSSGVRRAPYEFRRLLRAALIGATPGLVLSWLLIWRWWWWPFLPGPDSAAPVIARYVGCAAVVLGGALYAVHRSMRGGPALGRTILAMAVMVPVAGGLAVPITMGFASLAGYSTSLPVLAVEAAIVAGAVAGAIVLARRWALAPTLGRRRAPAR